MNYPENYWRCDELNLWLPKRDEAVFNYSDGTEEEAYLENCIKKVSDLSCHSAELAGCIRDWSSEYHLSPKRSNLLRPLLLGQDTSVLELGAGCGAITRYLGEKTAKVIAVEGSETRAKIAALRCRELENVQIVHDNFQNIKFLEKFDIVTLIGVLEYSQKYIDLENPHQQALEIARSHLKDDGILVLAIENKLGLKYFAGCSEDHTGLLFDGLENYSSGSLIKTFGKQELEDLLRLAGFANFKFLYPFPDYKLPDVVLRLDESKQYDSKPFLYNWLGYINSRDYSQRKIEIFQEFLVAKQIEANGFLPQVSNSFLVLASVGETCIEKYLEQTILAWKYNVMRNKKFMTQVCLSCHKSQGLDSLIVKREPVYPELVVQEQEIDTELKHYAHESIDFVSGTTLMEEMIRAIKSKTLGNEEPLKLCIKIWYDFLVTEADRLSESKIDLPGNYIDCTPWNLILNKDKHINYIDREWSYLERVPIKFVLFRGLLIIYHCTYLWIDAIWENLLPDKSLHSFMYFCFQLVSLELKTDEFNKFARLDWEFQSQVRLVSNENFDDFIKFLNTIPRSMLVVKSVERLDSQLNYTQSQLQQIQGNLEQTQSQLQQTQSQLQQTQSQLQQTQSQLQQTQSQLQQTQDDLERSHTTILAMESSKFWKLRKAWFQLKQGISFKGKP
jgi:SAM-dependent methyltransferase